MIYAKKYIAPSSGKEYSSATTQLTLSTGMAKPIPAKAPEGLTIAALTPINRPELSNSGPPELPGLLGASIWIMPLMVHVFLDLLYAPVQ